LTADGCKVVHIACTRWRHRREKSPKKVVSSYIQKQVFGKQLTIITYVHFDDKILILFSDNPDIPMCVRIVKITLWTSVTNIVPKIGAAFFWGKGGGCSVSLSLQQCSQ